MIPAYFEKGNPEKLPLIFIHAFPINRQMWRDQLEGLSEQFYVLAPDMPGFGETPPLEGSVDMSSYAQTVIDFMESKSIEQAVIGGCSMGGYIMFELWRKDPKRFMGMILCDTRCEADTDEAREKRMKTIESVRLDGTQPLADNMLPNLLSAENVEKNKEMANEIRDTILGTNPQGIIHALEAMASRPDSTPTTQEINVPTLIIVGEHDTLTPPELARNLQANIAGSKLEIIPDAGHLAPFENPDSVNQAILTFLKESGLIQ